MFSFCFVFLSGTTSDLKLFDHGGSDGGVMIVFVCLLLKSDYCV